MRLLRSSASFPPALRGAVAAIGNFDGVHLGHRALIQAVHAEADTAAKPRAVITFEPHPRRFFVPGSPPFRLDALETKARILEGLGINATLALAFDAQLAAQSPQDFVDHILARDLGLSHVVVGYDFTFGKARAGNTDMLRDLGGRHNIGVTVVSAQGDFQRDGGEAYSSSRVRSLLEAGDVAAANRLLGRPWEIVGVVEHGDKRGRELGYPTANVALTDFQIPKFGIYAVRCVVDGEVHDGVASFGIRPTFDQTDVKLEVYLFDFSGDLYGRSMRVEFHGFLRPELKYEGPEPLKAQIAADVEAAKAMLAGR
ncbi:MAG: bifunctional riboflavin kinase/FAD synthetase [Ferrovibrio sp.]|uniref:bifunctional riboflavin kinase/FAD synthetase n=1 Tax=Ferrovibrio sp. TaxID=1917215 RepID=UPI00260C36F1|nr:bifunctional riboflavin kinase/FAD synthetase [Ferrovibrio sp.]MCW0235589.1 bifunctional riboflavin kinase/FAD synthetase [Ferrovibrio sp.]